MTSETAGKPWLENKQWVSREIRDKLSTGDFWFQILLIFLITGGPGTIMIALPIAASEPLREAWPNLLGGVFMFLLFGAYLYWVRSDLRFGRNNVCRLVTLPGVIGGWFKADIECNMPLDAGSAVLIRLENREFSGRSEVVLWAMEQQLVSEHIRKLPDGRAVVPVRLHIARQSEQKSSQAGSLLKPTFGWVLTVTRKAKPVDFSSQFIVPVYHTSAAPPDEQRPDQPSSSAGRQIVTVTQATNERGLLGVRVAGCLFGLVLAAYGGPHTWNVWRLADEGKEAVAKVTAYQPSQCGRSGAICEFHKLAADGHEFFIVLDARHAPGEEIRITYLPRDPSIALPGPRSDSRWHNLLQIVLGRGGFEVLIFLFGILSSMVGLLFIIFSSLNEKRKEHNDS